MVAVAKGKLIDATLSMVRGLWRNTIASIANMNNTAPKIGPRNTPNDIELPRHSGSVMKTARPKDSIKIMFARISALTKVRKGSMRMYQ